MKQIRLTITVDEGFVADSLRSIANDIENRSGEGYPEEIEDPHYIATITEED